MSRIWKKIAAFIAAFWETAVSAVKAFFGIKAGDSSLVGSGKVVATAIRRIIYVIADYYLAILCAALVAVLKYWRWGFVEIFSAVWVYDFIVAAAFVVIAEKTGQDVTLGEAYRNGADVVMNKSRFAGYIAFTWVFIKATVWDGPEHIVIFFRKELRTYVVMTVALVVLTVIQAGFWTWAYGLGYDSVFELIKNF
jgi:hypothetical protein